MQKKHANIDSTLRNCIQVSQQIYIPVACIFTQMTRILSTRYRTC